MEFTLTHTRKTIGQEIEVKVEADEDQKISLVRTEFDGSTLADDALASPTVQYDRTFEGAGAGIGQQHTLVVTATDEDGNSESATKMWIDDV